MVELAYTNDLKSFALWIAGSIPASSTNRCWGTSVTLGIDFRFALSPPFWFADKAERRLTVGQTTLNERVMELAYIHALEAWF